MEVYVSDYQDLLESLQEEELTIRFSSFTNERALEIGLRFVEIAKAEELAIAIDIRRHGQQLFHYALPGTTPDNDAWIERKIRVVERFGHSSYFMGISCKAKNTTLAERYLVDPREYAAHGGAFPIIIENVGIVGAVAVSGLPQEDDHRLVVRVLREFCNRP